MELLNQHSIAKKRKASALIKALDGRIAENNDSLSDVTIKITELTEKINGVKQIALSKDEFLNLLKLLPDKIENTSIVEKDAIFRIMLLNLSVDDQKRPHFLWKEPFATLLKEAKLNSGARDRT